MQRVLGGEALGAAEGAIDEEKVIAALKGGCRRFDGALVGLVAVYSPEDKNRMARRLYHHNRGYAVGEVIDFDV